MDIVLNEYRVDGLTGRMEIDVQSVTQVSPNQKITGPIKTYGIEPGAVQIAHDGSIEKWLAWGEAGAHQILWNQPGHGEQDIRGEREDALINNWAYQTQEVALVPYDRAWPNFPGWFARPPVSPHEAGRFAGHCFLRSRPNRF